MAKSFRFGSAPKKLPVYPANVLYARPNPDGTRKQCMNCVLWIPADRECQIHDADVVTPPDAVCGYHVYGKPSGAGLLDRTNMDPVPPELSGLEQVPGGTSCDTCRFYEPQGSSGGLCQFLDDPDEEGAHPLVESLGCCTRWEQGHE